MIRRTICVILIIFLSSIVLAEVTQDVLTRLDSTVEEDRLDACLILGKLSDPQAIPLLKDKLKDSSMLVRCSAANALARIGGKEVNAIFQELISSQSIEKKRIGLAGLAMTGDPGSIESVMQELDNSDWQVRWSAVYALGQWGYRPALPKLKEMSQNDPYKDSVTGEYAIRKKAEDTCKKILCSIEWYRNLKDAVLLSEKLQKPVWIYWYIEDNNTCKMMDELLFSAEISDVSQGFICVRLDAVKEQESVLQYDINAVPCTIILDKNGNDVDRILGIVSSEEMLKKLKNVLDGKGTPKEWKELISKNPDDVESSWHLAEWYLDNGRIESAVPLLENVVEYDASNQSGYADNALFALGYSFGAIGQYKKAVDNLEKLRTKYPGFKDMDKALYCLGLSYLSLNKPDLAKKIFNELVEIYPDSKTIKPAKAVLEKLT